jgi:hypothetical protein
VVWNLLCSLSQTSSEVGIPSSHVNSIPN